MRPASSINSSVAALWLASSLPFGGRKLVRAGGGGRAGRLGAIAEASKTVVRRDSTIEHLEAATGDPRQANRSGIIESAWSAAARYRLGAVSNGSDRMGTACGPALSLTYHLRCVRC